MSLELVIDTATNFYVVSFIAISIGMRVLYIIYNLIKLKRVNKGHVQKAKQLRETRDKSALDFCSANTFPEEKRRKIIMGTRGKVTWIINM